MKKIISLLRNLFRKKNKWYGFKVATYKFPAFKVGLDPFSKDDQMTGFAMIIPKEAVKRDVMVEDRRGAPVYAGCKAKGGCACTGACRVVIDWTKDPVKLASHRQYIAQYNEFQKTGLQQLYGERKWEPGGTTFDGITFITNRDKNIDNE